MNVRPRVIQRRVRLHLRVDRPEVGLEPRVRQRDLAVEGVHAATARQPRRGHAVEGVGAGGDGRENVVRLGNAQQVARPVVGQLIGDPAADLAQALLFQRAADAVAGESPLPGGFGGVGKLDQAPRGAAPQVLVLGALHHAEELLERALALGEITGEPGHLVALAGQAIVLVEAALRPAVRPLDGGFLVFAGVHQRGQLVEREDDVRAELVLDAHGKLRREPVRAAVDVAAEGHALLVDERVAFLAGGEDVVVLQAGDVHGQGFAKAHAQAHDLEPAGVGERRSVPVLEPRQTARRLHDVGARLQVQVVRVRQHRLRAGVPDLLGRQRLHRRLRAHRDERRRLHVPVRGADDSGSPRLTVHLLDDAEVALVRR